MGVTRAPTDWRVIAVGLLRWAGKRHDFKLPPLDSASLLLLKERRIDSLYYLATASYSPLQSVYTKVWTKQSKALAELLDCLQSVDCETLVVKGAEFIERYYQGAGLSFLNDIDLLVRREHLEKVKRSMHGLGYRQAFFSREAQRLQDRDISDICRIESEHYELAPFCRLEKIELTADEVLIAKDWQSHPLWVVGDTAYAVVEFDFHHQLASDIESGRFFKKVVPSIFPGASTLSLGDHVWFTISRLYHEVALHGKRSLRDFAYVAPVLKENIEWGDVLDAASEYGLHSSLYYYLRFLHSVLGDGVPQHVLENLSPQRGPRLRDWGWQLGPLFDFVEEEPRIL